jgi:competence protein ComEC
VGERLLAPALWKMGVKRIDYMVLSHPHPDHIQGLKYVAANFEVGEFWEGSRTDSRDCRELHLILADRRVPVRMIGASSPVVTVGEARIEPLGPPVRPAPGPAQELEDADLNDESMVFRLVFGKFSMLFTGDIGVETEEFLLRHPERLKCSILKVPHHGSRYSSSPPFLRAADPGIALIGAGYRNSFRLPARQTLDSLSGLGVQVYRTDLDGTIRITSDGQSGIPSVEKYQGIFIDINRPNLLSNKISPVQ